MKNCSSIIIEWNILKRVLVNDLRNIFRFRMPCSFVTYALLGSYVVQSELGDFCSDEHGHDVEYLRPFQFAPTQTDDLLEKIAELHRTHRSEICFCQNCNNWSQ